MTGARDHAAATWGLALSWLQRHPGQPAQPRKFRTQATRRAEDGGSEGPGGLPTWWAWGPGACPLPSMGRGRGGGSS